MAIINHKIPFDFFFISFNNFEDFLEFAQELSNAMKKC